MIDCPRRDTEPMPVSECPRCGFEHPDPDGFGTAYCGRCGYCRHYSETLYDRGWVCDACRRVRATDDD